MVGVEFLHNTAKIPHGGYFLFAALRIRDCHGGPGRAHRAALNPIGYRPNQFIFKVHHEQQPL